MVVSYVTKMLKHDMGAKKLLKCELQLYMSCECHVPPSMSDVKMLCHDQKCVTSSKQADQVEIRQYWVLTKFMRHVDDDNEVVEVEMLIEYNLKFMRLGWFRLCAM